MTFKWTVIQLYHLKKTLISTKLLPFSICRIENTLTCDKGNLMTNEKQKRERKQRAGHAIYRGKRQ